MSTVITATTAKAADWIAWGVATLALGLIIELHLLPAFLAGLTVYSLVDVLVPRLKIASFNHERRQWLAVVLVATLVVAALTALGLGVASFFKDSDESVPALFARMAEIIEQSKGQLPGWLLASLPDNAQDLRQTMVEWLRNHAHSVQTASTEALRGFAHVLVGMVIGALLSLQGSVSRAGQTPLTASFFERAARMAEVFKRVVFAQAWISAINTVITGIYLSLALPLLGIHLPLTKTLLAFTFVIGLVPILGNLISNSAIFIVSLSQSLTLALISLAYLFVIHKLGYFLNARIIGSHIRARAWELLLAMLVMEAAFGIPGLIIAPMAYAFFKDELRDKGLI